MGCIKRLCLSCSKHASFHVQSKLSAHSCRSASGMELRHAPAAFDSAAAWSDARILALRNDEAGSSVGYSFVCLRVDRVAGAKVGFPFARQATHCRR